MTPPRLFVLLVSFGVRLSHSLCPYNISRQGDALCAVWLGFNKHIVYSSNSNGEQTSPWQCSDPTSDHPYGLPVTEYCAKYNDDDDLINNWVGVTCDLSYHCLVTRIELIDNRHLSGTISPLITSLTGLRILALTGADGGYISGTIPSGIGNLHQLTGLFLFGNYLAGPIPRSIDSLSSLEYLLLRDNTLTGLVPSTLCQMTSIQVLDLSNNSLRGPLPDSFCCLTTLTALFLNDNGVSCYPNCVLEAPASGPGRPYNLHTPSDIVPYLGQPGNQTYGELAGWLTNIVGRRFAIDSSPACVPPTLEPTSSPTSAPTTGISSLTTDRIIVEGVSVGQYLFYLTFQPERGYQLVVSDCSTSKGCANPASATVVPSMTALLNDSVVYIGLTISNNISALCLLDDLGYLYYVQGLFNKTSYAFNPYTPTLLRSYFNFTGAVKATFSVDGSIGVCVNKTADPSSLLPPWFPLNPKLAFPNVTAY